MSGHKTPTRMKSYDSYVGTSFELTSVDTNTKVTIITREAAKIAIFRFSIVRGLKIVHKHPET